ncbi:DgyrCDS2257 [Dimorphilus gyrociliatus]|uniref:DgyrCDS2257 n=1 Tax=Dimorphilus gyrociliatus TaxID=2664684 RepID=A0A7I8VEU8_9ANNE|nr:DgyrCDS2257 [Dimorphilus gyrociliatus]
MRSPLLLQQQLAVSGYPTNDRRSPALSNYIQPHVPAYGTATKTRRYQGLPPGGPVARLRVVSNDSSYRNSSDVELERPPSSYESLRNRATDAKNKMHLHKTMLDRYLPISFGPENAVEYEVEFKFDELAQRMPSLDPRRPTRYYRGSSLPPPSRGTTNNKSFAESYRPGMSDTRKKLRQVICQAKKDPHYFA